MFLDFTHRHVAGRVSVQVVANDQPSRFGCGDSSLELPVCFYGYKPTLFDTPGRAHRRDMDWTAHTFLAATPIESGARQVKPLQGFSWGFAIRDRAVQLAPVLSLAPNDWDGHIRYLQATYPSWEFDSASGW